MEDNSSNANSQPWHSLATDEILQIQETDAKGLSREEAEQRLLHHGPNSLPARQGHSAFIRFLLQFHNILIYVLLGSAGITALLGHLTDTMVILAVVLANAVIGYYQEGKAEKAMESIRDMLAPTASVIRSGKRLTVPGDSLVPGDIVLLEAGDKVPADLRLLQSHGLQVQEAILTGESVPVEKSTTPVAAEAALGDRFSMAYSGTLVTSGQARGIVTTTGADTEIGRISGLLGEVEMLTTPLVLQMNVFARWLTFVILLIAAVLIVYGYFVADYNFDELFMIVVGLSVAAIPEGLPAVLTITLAIGVQAMARRNAIIRRLPAIETLGAVSVICSDKTGTLTRNEMMVAQVFDGTRDYAVEGTGYAPDGRINPAGGADTNLQLIARACALCNDAQLHERDGVWQVEGDPMEGALLAFAAKAGVDLQSIHEQYQRTHAIPFDSRHRFMATLNHVPDKEGLIFVKGAPEKILEMCERQLDSAGEPLALDVNMWQQQALDIASKGQRVLAFAYRQAKTGQVSLEHEDVSSSLTMLGLTGLIDPPREEAVDAVAECHGAGIRVKMITGDHASTAKAIGQQIGLTNAESVLTGNDLDAMTDDDLKQAILDTDIFARTSPEHKLRLVMALQAHGMTVAMTGDGVNDAPALKRADAGIAMGRKGSEAAKEASELVLADDNFASIVAAVREGRTVYDNIKKVISWTLPTNGGESLVLIVALLLGMTVMPITPIQILWVNMITAVTLGLALAFEPTEANTMRRPPRPRSAPLLDAALVWQVILVSGLFLCGVFGIHSYAMSRGYTPELATTLAVNTLVVMEIFNLFFVRNIYGTSLTWQAVRGTRTVWLTITVVTLAQFAITYLPPLQRIFGTQAVSFTDGLLIIAIGVILFAIIETEKQIRLRLQVLTPGTQST